MIRVLRVRFHARLFSNCTRILLSPKTVLQMEEAVGMTEFLGSGEGIRGILKQRFSDFVVREISAAGDIVRFSSVNGDDLEKVHFPKQERVEVSEESVDNFMEVIESLSLIPSADMKTSLREYLLKCLLKEADTEESFTSFPCTVKESRKEAHTLIKAHLSSIVEADTVSLDGQQHIRFIARHKKAGGKTNDIRRAPQWPSKLGNYLRFTLIKENVDTMSAMTVLQKYLRIKSGGIEYCGTKDKRAVTLQHCTIYRRKPSDFRRLNGFEGTPFIRCGDFCYVDKELTLGDSLGNHFDIVLREVTADESVIRTRCDLIQRFGFLNYFGLQRFGKGAVLSDKIGREIFFQNWERAIRMMFVPREGDRTEISAAKEAFNAGNYSQALALLPSQMYSERCAVDWLVLHPNDFHGAFLRIPKNTRLLCAHAYQSAVYNKALSLRIKLHGLKCVEGDLVDTSRTELGGLKGDLAQRTGAANQEHVKVASKADVKGGLYTINDVLLPLVGADTRLPQNEIGPAFLKILEEDGLTLDHFRTKCTPEYRMSGAYRRIVQQAKDFSWRLIPYIDLNAELIQTELIDLRTASKLKSVDTDRSRKASGEQMKQALHLSFSLPSGTYATMLLREVTKESTETEFHSRLTEASRDLNQDEEHDGFAENNDGLAIVVGSKRDLL